MKTYIITFVLHGGSTLSVSIRVDPFDSKVSASDSKIPFERSSQASRGVYPESSDVKVRFPRVDPTCVAGRD